MKLRMAAFLISLFYLVSPLHAEGTKTFIIGAETPVSSLITARSVEAVHYWVNSNLFEPLTLHLDNKGTVTPGLAESWEGFNKSTRFEFKIRDNITWSDGTPIDAASIRESFLGLIKNNKMQPAMLLKYVEGASAFRNGSGDASAVGVKALDGNILEFRLTEPLRDFPGFLTDPSLAPMPVHLFDVYDENFDKAPGSDWAFSGPYMITKVDGTDFTAERNPRFYDQTLTHIDGFRFKIIERNLAQALQMLEKGDLDMATMYISTQEDFKKLFLGDYVISTPQLSTTHWLPNVTKPPLDDADIRRALYMAIEDNIGGMVDGTVSQYVLRTQIASIMPDYPGDVFPSWHDKDYQARRQEALAILTEKGYTKENPLQLSISVSDHEMHQRSANVTVAMWSFLPVKIEVKTYTTLDFIQMLQKRDFMISRSSWMSPVDLTYDMLSGYS
ncbi:MAG: ABC transporter substrate-binding protein [Paracoccus sp. (in: a-proteobacteria)]